MTLTTQISYFRSKLKKIIAAKGSANGAIDQNEMNDSGSSNDSPPKKKVQLASYEKFTHEVEYIMKCYHFTEL